MFSARLIAAALACAVAAPALAQVKYPSKPIRMLVPNAPGSSVDVLSRIVANGLSQVLGQSVVVDNRAGAAGVIGMEIARNANPDGYTMIAATTAASTIARLLQKTPTFDPLVDYEIVAQFAETPNVLVVHPALPIRTVKELIAYATAGKKSFHMASAGAGSQSHLSGAFFQQAARIDSLHVPYKGGGASVAAVVSGESHWTLTPAAAVMGQVNAGQVRAIGHSLPRPTALLPGIPPIAETLPGFDYSGWQGFFMPRGTPKPILERLRAAVAQALELPEVRKAIHALGVEIVIRGPDEFRKVVRESMEQNARIVKALGLTAVD
jgi:tripartite-type tricarboxylate transporter receptor subunit TctC